MKRVVILSALFLAGCATTPPDVKRLSPIIGSSKVPPQCAVVSVLKDSPAEKAGITAGDILKSVNGQVPSDAATLSDVVLAAPQDSDFEVAKKDGTVQHLKIHLNQGRPRLGSVCDLAGWEKPGLTAAGNESVTVFQGPFAMTASGILDKGFAFVRVRVTNNLNTPLEIKPEFFTATDGSGVSLPLLSPKEVMCQLYGEKGAHLLALKKKQKETLDAHESITGMQAAADESCEKGVKGRLSASDPQFADANAQYLATESLWPSTYPAGGVADGLIYMKEPSSLPVTLVAAIGGMSLAAKLGSAVGSDHQMKRSELKAFFQGQKHGNSVRLTTKKGKVFVGKFTSYDEVEERAWFSTPSSGMLNTTSFSIDVIRNAAPLEQVPAKPAPASDM